MALGETIQARGQMIQPIRGSLKPDSGSIQPEGDFFKHRFDLVESILRLAHLLAPGSAIIARLQLAQSLGSSLRAVCLICQTLGGAYGDWRLENEALKCASHASVPDGADATAPSAEASRMKRSSAEAADGSVGAKSRCTASFHCSTADIKSEGSLRETGSRPPRWRRCSAASSCNRRPWSAIIDTTSKREESSKSAHSDSKRACNSRIAHASAHARSAAAILALAISLMRADKRLLLTPASVSQARSTGSPGVSIRATRSAGSCAGGSAGILTSSSTLISSTAEGATCRMRCAKASRCTLVATTPVRRNASFEDAICTFWPRHRPSSWTRDQTRISVFESGAARGFGACPARGAFAGGGANVWAGDDWRKLDAARCWTTGRAGLCGVLSPCRCDIFQTPIVADRLSAKSSAAAGPRLRASVQTDGCCAGRLSASSIPAAAKNRRRACSMRCRGKAADWRISPSTSIVDSSCARRVRHSLQRPRCTRKRTLLNSPSSPSASASNASSE